MFIHVRAQVVDNKSDIDAELAAQQAESEAASKAFDAELATLNAELAQREAALVVAYTQRSKSALKNGTAAALLADSEVALMYHVPKLHLKLLLQVLLHQLHMLQSPPPRRLLRSRSANLAAASITMLTPRLIGLRGQVVATGGMGDTTARMGKRVHSVHAPPSPLPAPTMARGRVTARAHAHCCRAAACLRSCRTRPSLRRLHHPFHPRPPRRP